MYRYETHLHTSPVSRCARASVRETLEFYKSLGYDGVFITNHFLDGNINIDYNRPYEERINFYFADYEEGVKLSKEIGIKVFCGVELSYLSNEEQRAVLEAIELYDCTPSYSQACRLHRDSEMMYASDTRKRVLSVMSEEKPNQREQIRLRREDFRSFFPADYTDKQIRDDIIAGLNLLKRQRYRDRGVR